EAERVDGRDGAGRWSGDLELPVGVEAGDAVGADEALGGYRGEGAGDDGRDVGRGRGQGGLGRGVARQKRAGVEEVIDVNGEGRSGDGNEQGEPEHAEGAG